MGRIKLHDFFEWYDPKNSNHLAAVELLDQALPETLARDKSAWVQKYREPLPGPHWPITREEMRFIMQCPEERLSDDVMDDFARCVDRFKMDRLQIAYFLGQVGHESAGLRYTIEIHDGSNYEGRTDLGNTEPGWGVKYAGTGYIQVTGAYWHSEFSNFIGDERVISEGKTYTAERYPWSISGFWWDQNNMNEFCKGRSSCTHGQIDEVGARVNGRMRPNGADDRIAYTTRAYQTLIGP